MKPVRGNYCIYIGYHESDNQAAIRYRDYKYGVKEVYDTMVKSQLSGQGIGKILVAEMAELARDEGFKIYPTCPYAAKVMLENSEYEDVLYLE
ncbi:MAG: N-acetyltransferase [Tissierellia bacterium]|nr:N-acetyltransferase [Tissierellia bacterium]